MSRDNLAIIVLNLGGEMFYVLDQRLKSQKIPPEKASRVLNEMAVAMYNQRFLEDMFKPKRFYDKEELYDIFKEFAHASIMKLNDTSMGKLFDLMLMVFKYQTFFAFTGKNILLVTLNHLDSMKSLVSSSLVHKQLDVVYFMLMQKYSPMSENKLLKIRYEILNYFQDVKIKVSLLLRQGLQNDDGTFVIPSNTAECALPGIIKIFDPDGSVKDIRTFPAGEDYKMPTEQGSLEYAGNRGISLGKSIYAMEVNKMSLEYWNEGNEDRKCARKNPYRCELNTMVTELIGNMRVDEGDGQLNDALNLDLFAEFETSQRSKGDDDELEETSSSPEENSSEMNICSISSIANEALIKIASEINVDITDGDDEKDLFKLLETADEIIN